MTKINERISVVIYPKVAELAECHSPSCTICQQHSDEIAEAVIALLVQDAIGEGHD